MPAVTVMPLPLGAGLEGGVDAGDCCSATACVPVLAVDQLAGTVPAVKHVKG